MNYIQLPEPEVRELNRQMFTIFRYFSNIVSNIATENQQVVDKKNALTVEVDPWNAYHFRLADKEIKIHLLRSGHFCLDVRGFVLEDSPLTRSLPRLTSDYRYQNFYGDFEKLDDCVVAFKKVLKQIIDSELGALF